MEATSTEREGRLQELEQRYFLFIGGLVMFAQVVYMDLNSKNYIGFKK